MLPEDLNRTLTLSVVERLMAHFGLASIVSASV
jgi:hypothetical protein